jgi:hypothetical protein
MWFPNCAGTVAVVLYPNTACCLEVIANNPIHYEPQIRTHFLCPGIPIQYPVGTALAAGT